MVASVEARRRLRERGRATDPWWGSPLPRAGVFLLSCVEFGATIEA